MSKGHLLEEDNAYGNDVIKRRHLDDVIHIGRFFLIPYRKRMQSQYTDVVPLNEKLNDRLSFLFF
jgi:hypothetical protein